jgi:hypothetical protein
MKGTMISDFEPFKIGIGPSNAHVVVARLLEQGDQLRRDPTEERRRQQRLASPGARLPPISSHAASRAGSLGRIQRLRGRYVVPLSEL